MIKNYKQFNESLIDKLQGPDENELMDGLSKMDPYTMLMKSLEIRFSPGIKLAIERGADFHDNEEKIFRTAVHYEDVEMVKLLIEHGVNVSALNNYSICEVGVNGNIEIYDLLVKAGVDIHAEGDYLLQVLSANGTNKLLSKVLKENKFSKKILELALEYAVNNEQYETEKIIRKYLK